MRRFGVQRVSQDPKLRVDGFESLQVVWEGGGRVFCRGYRLTEERDRRAVLVVFPADPVTPNMAGPLSAL